LLDKKKLKPQKTDKNQHAGAWNPIILNSATWVRADFFYMFAASFIQVCLKKLTGFH
jgi:hypothetical protein